MKFSVNSSLPASIKAMKPMPNAIATIHPSAVLRADDREAAYAGSVRALQAVRRHLQHASRCPGSE